MINWISDNTLLLIVASGISFFIFAAGIVCLPFFVSRLPVNFFLETPRPWYRRLTLLPYITVMALKNIVGVILLLLGMLMLFMPGQGLLTILVGLAVINFPGKRQLIDRLLSFEKLRRLLNWIRRKNGAAEFKFPLK